jgi:hypothetical protein
MSVCPDEAAARELADDMMALSEHHFDAGWLTDLEFLLWNAITGRPKGGTDELSDERITHLQNLSAACGGWMRWPTAAENDCRPEDDKLWDPVWCPLADWEQRFAKWRA